MTGSTATPGEGAVIVSGGSRGLGRALVEALLRQSVPVATFSRNGSEFLDRHREEPRLLWQPVDGTDYPALTAFVKAAEERFGRIRGLVNNAALAASGLLTTMSVADIDRVIDVNVRGQIYLTKLAVSRMLKHREGAVVNISSINALRGHAGVAAYSASKGAVDAMTRSLARELGPKGIRVNAVAPGYFASDMVRELGDEAIQRITRRTPLGRLCTEADIVSLVLYLLNDALFVTGQTIAIDGGYTC
jgi:3-oxoacyl-[acyl-carrier protein] reductase